MRIKVLALLLIIVTLSGCATYYNPATGRKEQTWTSIGEEQTIARTTAMKLLSGKRRLPDQRAQQVFDRVISAIPSLRVPKTLTVYEDSSVNAANVGGGYIYVSTALLANTTDDELAAVLAHEIGHDEARHVIKNVEAGVGYSALVNIAYALDNRKEYEKKQDWELIKPAADAIYGLTSLGFTRGDEYEADRLSIRYMRQAGYNPTAIISLFNKMKYIANDPQWIYFLRSHPYLDERIAAAYREINNLKGSNETIIVPQEPVLYRSNISKDIPVLRTTRKKIIRKYDDNNQMISEKVEYLSD